MSQKSKYVEMVLKDPGNLPAHVLTGYAIVADYKTEAGRHLTLRRAESQVPVKRTRKVREPGGDNAG